MSWKEEIKKRLKELPSQTVGKDLDNLVGLEGSLVQLMQEIREFFPEADNVKIVYDSSSRPVIGFNLPIFVTSSFGSKEFPSNTEVFTIKHVQIGEK